MKIQRIFGIAYMNWIVLRRNWFRLFDVTLWPLILFYSITLFIKFMGAKQEMIAMVVMGIIGWRAVYHFQIESSVSYMDNYWGRILPHTLATPVKAAEMVVANLLMSLVKFLMVLVMYLVISYFMFSFAIPNLAIFTLGILYLCLAGLVIGMITYGFTILYHENAITFAYMLPDLIVLLSGVYYPIAVFPSAIQSFVHIFPTFYGFEMLKSTVGYGHIDVLGMIVCLLIWTVIALAFLSYAQKRAKRLGLSGKFN